MSSAMNGLGVYWLHHGNNYTKAVQYFQMAQDLGHSDGAYNRGTMHLHSHKDKKSKLHEKCTIFCHATFDAKLEINLL